MSFFITGRKKLNIIELQYFCKKIYYSTCHKRRLIAPIKQNSNLLSLFNFLTHQQQKKKIIISTEFIWSVWIALFEVREILKYSPITKFIGNKKFSEFCFVLRATSKLNKKIKISLLIFHKQSRETLLLVIYKFLKLFFSLFPKKNIFFFGLSKNNSFFHF